MKEKHIVRIMMYVYIPGKRRRGHSNLRWKDACKIAMREARLKEDNATNMEEEANQLYRRLQMMGRARDEAGGGGKLILTDGIVSHSNVIL